jgi:hypothetical protein
VWLRISLKTTLVLSRQESYNELIDDSYLFDLIQVHHVTAPQSVRELRREKRRRQEVGRAEEQSRGEQSRRAE